MTKHNENSEFKPEHKTYWIHKLSGGLPILNRSGVKSHPNVKSKKGHAFCSFFSKPETEILYVFVSNEGENLFARLLTTWNILFFGFVYFK